MRNVATTARAAMGFLLGMCMSPAMGSEPEPIDAVWKAQRITLLYRGSTTFYTCDLFERNVRVAMRALGAHADIVVDRNGCNSRDVRLTVTFRSPIEASDENLKALTAYSAEDELIARLNGTRLSSAADLPQFPAEWSSVSFANDRRMRLTPGDCEFVDSLRRQLLPHIRVRVVSNRLFCSPGSLSISGPQLKVVALIAQQPAQAPSR